MKSKNKLIILGLLMAVFLGLPSINAFAAAIKWDGGAGTTNWNDANNWDGDVVPTSSDDVTLDNSLVVTAYTVNVNTAADVNSLTINETAGVILRPDASSARTMRVRDNLVLTAGSILYTNAGTTGRLSWTFDGSGATNSIKNDEADEAKMQFFNLTIDGSITTPNVANEGDMEIYGNLTINGSFLPNTGATNSHVYFKGSGKTITNNGSLELNTVTYNNNSSYTTNTDLTVNGDMNVASGSSLILQNPSIVTFGTATKTLTNAGTLTFQAGSSLNVNANTTLVGDLANFAGDLTVAAAITLKVTATNEIAGTGSITTGAASVINVNDGDGVAGAIDLDTYSWNATTDYIIEGGITGFTGASITALGNLTLGIDAGAVLVITINDSFTMSGDITIPTNTGFVTTVTATSGTITMSGTETITINDNEVIDFYGLNIDGTANTVTISADKGITVNNWLEVATGCTLTGTPSIATTLYDYITFDGTATLVVDGTLTFPDYAEMEISGSLTLDGNLSLTQATSGGINVQATGTLDFAANTVTLNTQSDFVTVSGATLKTALPAGFNGNLLAGGAAGEAFTVVQGTNLEYNTGATDFGLDALIGVGNARVDFATTAVGAGDITINGASLTENNSTDIDLIGDFTVTTGSADLNTNGETLIFSSAGAQNLTNSTASTSNLVLGGIVVDGAGTIVTTSGDFTLNGNATLLDFTSGAGTLNALSSVITISAAGDLAQTVASTCNFSDIIITAGAVTMNTADIAGVTFNIAGDLTLSGGSLNSASGTAGRTTVAFNGSSEQTIETNGNAVTFDAVTISNSAGVVTDDDMTFGNDDGNTIISGQFVASAGTITFGGTTNALTVSGNSATFFILNAGTALTSTGDFAIVKTLDGTSYTQTSDDLTFYGDPAAAALDATANGGTDVLTNDGKKEASVVSLTTFSIGGQLLIDNSCELQTAVAITGAGNIRVDGRLELTADAATSAATIDLTDDTYGDGGELHISGATTNGLDDIGTVTTDNTSTLWLDGAIADAGLGTRTVLNLYLDASVDLILNGTDIVTVAGNINQTGTAMTTGGNAASTIILSGANSQINGTSQISVGILSIAATATGATGNATIELTNAGAGAFTLASGGAFTSTGLVEFNGGTAASIVNNGAFDDVVFHDVTITQTTIVSNDISINGSLTIVAGQDLTAIVADANVYFTGSGETITIGGDNDLILHDVSFTGSYGLAGDFIIDIDGDLEVTNTGSFDMNSVGELDFQGTASSTITNEGSLIINDLTSSGGTALVTTDDFTVEGDFTTTGATFVASGSSLITFDGTTALVATGTATETQFVSITVDGAVTLTNHITMTGNLIVNGTFVPNTATANSDDDVYFAGATTKTIQNNGTLTFGDFNITDVASNIVNTTSNFNVLSDFYVGGLTGGKFEATAGTISFIGGAAANQDLNNGTTVATNVKFYNVNIGTASTVFRPLANSDFYINGNLTMTNDAVLNAQTNDVRIFFAGAGQQDINLTGTGTVGTSARLLLHNATINNSNGLKLVGTTNDMVINQLSVQGTLRLQSGDIDLNGSNILTIDVNTVATAKLDETAGNTVVNNGPSTSTGHVYAVQTPGASLSNINFGGLGAIITSGDPGTLTVKRYHIPLTVGNQTQASRYYSIDGSTTTGLDAKLVFKYDASELGVLTEDDLILVYGDDPAVDVWTIQESTLNTDLRRLTTPNSAIDGFTGQTEWWTIGTPDVLTATSITNGLATTPISAGTNDNAIFGVQYTSTGSVDISSVRFNLGRNLGATNEVAKWKLVYSEDDDFSTTEDNYTMIDVAPGGTNTTGGTSGLSYVTFDVSGQDAAYNVVNEGTPVNYFLVTDIVSTVTAATSTITPASTNLLTTITDGITEEFSLTGSAYAFRASIMVSPHEVGLTDAPLIAGQSDVVLFGYKASVTSAAGLPGITGFSLSFDQDPSAVFENVRVYSSVAEHDFADMAAGDLISLASSNVTSTEFDITFSAKRVLATTPTYFFVVADVKDGVRNTSPDITPTLTYANLESSDAGIRGTDINGNAASSHNGFVYSFVNSTVTVDVNNNTAASNLGTRVDRQPIFGFTLTPDNNQPVSFTGANLTVTLSAAALANNLSNWSLYYDANGNGFGETSEKIANGTLTSTSGVGNLTFTGFTQSLSSARKYLVGVKVGSGATAGSTVKVQLTSTDYITLASPAKLNATGPLPATAVTHTIRTAGTATALTLVHYNTSVTTGNTLGFTVRAVDANGYPTVVSAAETVTIAKVSGTGTVGGTATGTIVNGTNNVIVSPSLTAAAGSTDLVIVANGSSLTSSANSNAITILEAEPAANDAIVTIANITATTARITNITANSGSTDGRIVVIRQGSAPHVPTDATAYTANLDLASSGIGQTGPGSYVVMANVAAGAAAYSNDITGLMPNTRYYVQVFDYNGTTPNFNYATGTAFTSESVRNPISFTTSSGDISSASTETLPANIQTDIDITSTISAADEIDWYQFKIPSTKNNAIIRLSNLPANYEVELYDASAGIINKTLLRDSKVTLQGDEVIILNNAAGSYVLKVYGANGDAYSTSSYTLRVSTSNNEIFSQVE